MKFIRIIAAVLLALLYLGGTYAQVSGAAFPLVGTGEKAYGDFKGKAKAPVIPTISPRRHVPMVKSVVVSPLIPVDQPGFDRPQEFQIVQEPSSCPSSVLYAARTCGTRAPPAL